MADVETARARLFSPPALIAVSLMAILLIASAMFIVRSDQKTTLLNTEIRLGRNGAGNVFEPSAATMGRIQDSILEFPPEELLRKYGLVDLRSIAVASVVDSGTALRLRTVSFDRDREAVKALHQYLADQIINSLLPLATAERNRIQSEIDRVRDKLRSIEKEQAEHRAFRHESQKIQNQLSQLGAQLRDSISRKRNQDQPPKEIPERVASYVLLGDVERLAIISSPQQNAQSRFKEAGLEREKADLQAELRSRASELNRWEQPALVRLAVPRTGPYVSSRPAYIVTGLMTGGLVAFLLIWLFRWRARAAVRPQ